MDAAVECIDVSAAQENVRAGSRWKRSGTSYSLIARSITSPAVRALTVNEPFGGPAESSGAAIYESHNGGVTALSTHRQNIALAFRKAGWPATSRHMP